jgi:CheY-like chemotaxis protein
MVNELLTQIQRSRPRLLPIRNDEVRSPQFVEYFNEHFSLRANDLATKPGKARHGAMESILPRKIEKLLQSIEVLVIDDNQYMRKVIRNLLTSIGVKNVHEAVDGVAGLEAIRMMAPSLVILDWEMPLLTGAELVRIVRSPGVFPVPDIPIIMLTGHGQRWRVIEAANLGVNEFLKKPVSGKALLDRIVAILTKPRPMVRLGDYYGPEPRRPVHERQDRTEKVFVN